MYKIYFKIKNYDEAKLSKLGFEYEYLYDAYVYLLNTGASEIRFFVFNKGRRKDKLFVDSNRCETFDRDRIKKLLQDLNILDLFEEIEEEKL